MKAKLFIIPVLIILLTSCTQLSLFIVNSLAAIHIDKKETDIAYAEPPSNRLDIYYPTIKSQPDTLSPVIIFFYGGCWGGCQTYTKSYYQFVAQALNKHGYIVVIPDYRRYPEVRFDQIMHDAKSTVEWVQTHISQRGGNPEHMFLMGHSAGAHIASMLTLNQAYLSKPIYQNIKGFIGLAGPYDFLPFTKTYQKEVFGPEDKYPESQPINFVDGDEPPLLLLYGNQDTTVYPHNIENLSAKIQSSNGQVYPKIYNGLDHSSLLGALSIPYQNTTSVMQDIVDFIKQQLCLAEQKIQLQNG